LCKRRMECRIELQFPATEDPAWVLFLDLSGVDAFDTERFEQSLHVGIHLGVPQVPKLDRERAAEMPKQIHVDPHARKVFESSTSDDDSAFLGVSDTTGLEVVDVLVHQASMSFDGVVPSAPGIGPRSRWALMD